jgi:hypothetical protein
MRLQDQTFEVGVGEEHGLAPITALRDMTRNMRARPSTSAAWL